MKVLLSTIGSRGDVQPLVALALQLHSLRQEVRLCVPPDFQSWIEGLGLPVTPIGPELRPTAKPGQQANPPSPGQIQQMMADTVAHQFEVLGAAAQDCDLIVGATALQIAAPSIAEKKGIPYVFAAYCPCALPSPHHAPPVLTMRGDKPLPKMDDYSESWTQDAQRWNQSWRDLLNPQRANLGLPPVQDVRSYILTDRPWLAADQTLAPWPEPEDPGVYQTGAWLLPDHRPLPPELETFLQAGDPPVYFGFGSNRAPEDLSQILLHSARELGRRAILSRGWAGLTSETAAPDCLVIDEVNQQALFPRVAAVVHHGGAGTTTAAARAGVPQVLLPQHYDQYYWAQRIQHLGNGNAQSDQPLAPDSLTQALEQTLHPEVLNHAQAIAAAVRSDGARFAARALINLCK